MNRACVCWRCSECRTPLVDGKLACRCLARYRFRSFVFVGGLAILWALVIAECVWLLWGGEK